MHDQRYLISIVKATTISAAAGALLLVAGTAHGITVSGLNPDSSAFIATSSDFGSPYTGVAELLIVRSDLGYGVVEGCSGTLLADGVSILTSAHCIADAQGVAQATAAYVTFTTSDGAFKTQAVSFKVDPLYNGSATSPNDVAVVTLASAVPDTVARYRLYTGDTSDQLFTLAGYGFGGTGGTGYNSTEYPFGTLRVGENQYDPSDEGDDLMYDFAAGASGSPAGPRYSGADEAFIAPGDAAGPSFIGGEIPGSSTVLNSVLDSNFGEVGPGANVPYNLAFIESAMVLAPEPKLMIVLGIALVALALAGDKRKHH